MEYKNHLSSGAEKISQSKDINIARQEFVAISNSTIKMVDFFGSTGNQPIILFHCPMAFNNKGADWLQNKEGTENPYYGSQMFSCGDQVKIIVKMKEKDHND